MKDEVGGQGSEARGEVGKALTGIINRFSIKDRFIQVPENILQWKLLLDDAYTVLMTTHIWPHCFQKT